MDDGTKRLRYDLFMLGLTAWVPSYFKDIEKISLSQFFEPGDLSGDLVPWMENAREAVGPALPLITQAEAKEVHSLISRVLDKVEDIVQKRGYKLIDALPTLPQVGDVLTGLEMLQKGFIAVGTNPDPLPIRPRPTRAIGSGNYPRRDHWLEGAKKASRRADGLMKCFSHLAHSVGFAVNVFLVLIVLLWLAWRALADFGLVPNQVFSVPPAVHTSATSEAPKGTPQPPDRIASCGGLAAQNSKTLSE
jgi:hypothetical protein